ncbi:(d)CMP kinase [Desulfobotulus sp. H1]|uniref:Cytidylate kinase n=1 Tax=Desulfobotulus pelophilus TaxID=2823377 RepID=A0ABT3N9N0_9BACT|nr:(d)CMP kinase [Desulfobotulus pelophilus]MCW7754165.1 (d)CMP kinase [Desulfobotulus pelophilus]
MKSLVITIDGPAGAGKTTISRQLADRMGYRYVDTGALYRGVALCASRAGVDRGNEQELNTFLEGLNLSLVRGGDGCLRLYAGEQDITAEIRTPAISMAASAVAALPAVRSWLLGVQRRLGAEKGVVFEGRDMGSVVFPEADVKFFLTADLRVRAERRYEELPPDSSQKLEDVLMDMQRRDAQDSGRDLAPLVASKDATIIDASALTIDEVLVQMMDCIREKSGQERK